MSTTQDAAPLVQLRAALKNAVAEVGAAANLKAVASEAVGRILRRRRRPNTPSSPHDEQEQRFPKIPRCASTRRKSALAFGKAIDSAFAELEQHGFLTKLASSTDEGNQNGNRDLTRWAIRASRRSSPFRDVLFGEAIAQLHNRLKTDFGSPDMAERVFYWLKPKLIRPDDRR